MCHIRYLNSLKTHPDRITKADKYMVNVLDYEGNKFPVSKKDFSKIEQKNNFLVNVFCCENELTYPVHVSDQQFQDCIDLLLITDENESHYVYIKDFNRFMCNKTNNNNNNNNNNKHFCKCCLQCFSSKKVLIEHKETCFKINGRQTVKLKNSSIGFKNYFKQLAVLFKIFADFKSVLKVIKSNDRNNNTSYTEKYQDHIPCSFDYKVVCIDDKFSQL